MNLYEITKEVELLEQLMIESIDQETGEIIDVETVEELENELLGLLKNKSSNIVKYLANLKAKEEAISTEIKRLNTLKKVSKNKQERLKEYVKNIMIDNSMRRIETSMGDISLRRKPLTFEVTDLKLIDSSYKQERKEIRIDRATMKEDIKKGIKIKGIKIIDDDKSLSIR